jgi:hypothetical protein
VDEAGSKTQSPFITAPQLRDSDPDVDSDGAVIDNSSMSSSRTRSGSSRSGATGAGASRTQATPRADANAATANDDATSEATAEPDSEAAKPAQPAEAVKPVKPVKAPALPADGIRPSFTPAAATSAQPTKPASVTSPSAPSSAPATQAFSPPNYSRSSWSSTPDATSPAVTADSAGYDSSGYDSAGYDSDGYTAPARTNGTQSTQSQSNGGFAATAAGAAAGLGGAAAGLGGAAAGAAAGLASSVTAAFRGASGPKTRSDRPEPKAASAPKIKVRRSNKRQAMLTLSRLEPWSVMKFSFVASVVAFIILFVAVAVLYLVLSALGVFTSLEHQVASITSSKNTAGTNISHWFSASLILGWTALLGALNIVLITALSTIGSVIYNLIAKTVGGIEVTLRETD